MHNPAIPPGGTSSTPRLPSFSELFDLGSSIARATHSTPNLSRPEKKVSNLVRLTVFNNSKRRIDTHCLLISNTAEEPIKFLCSDISAGNQMTSTRSFLPPDSYFVVKIDNVFDAKIEIGVNRIFKILVTDKEVSLTKSVESNLNYSQ